MLFSHTSLLEILLANHPLPCPDPPFPRAPGYTVGDRSYRCRELLPRLPLAGDAAPRPLSPTQTLLYCMEQILGLTPPPPRPLDHFTVPRLPQSGGLSAGTLLWTTFSLSAGRAMRLPFACGWTTRRTTSTRGEMRWLVGERKGKDMLLSMMWGAHVWWGRLTFLSTVMSDKHRLWQGRGSSQRKLCLS